MAVKKNTVLRRSQDAASFLGGPDGLTLCVRAQDGSYAPLTWGTLSNLPAAGATPQGSVPWDTSVSAVLVDGPSAEDGTPMNVTIKCSVVRSPRTEPEAIAVAKAQDEQATRSSAAKAKLSKERENAIATGQQNALLIAEAKIEAAKAEAAAQPDAITRTVVAAVQSRIEHVVGDMLGAIGQASSTPKLPQADSQ